MKFGETQNEEEEESGKEGKEQDVVHVVHSSVRDIESGH